MSEEPREESGERNFEQLGEGLPLARPALPQERLSNFRNPVPLTTLRAVGEILVVLAFMFGPSFVRRMITGGGAVEQARELGASVYLMVFVQGAIVIFAIGVVLFWDRHPWRSIGLHFRDVGGELLAAVVALAVIYALQGIISVVVIKVFPQVLQRLGSERFEVFKMFPRIPIPVLALFTLFVGFYEELLFRGFLMTRLVKVFRSFGAALVVSSVIFALAHASYQDVLAVFQIFTVAIVIGSLFLIRRSLISPILVHAMFDFVSLLTAFYFFKK